ncbi:esterase/lipase family protein [Ramlibacter alkalitolerans]|uniref:Alpha/beta hydrolase n=1 Tax=Ramlibacter alkalitolerans TaxID=2039631 RepID=A0ABS1JM22_9BURK|nr:alpha/beta hydrolase [Ramlibacter alkalitolerans]MBL0425259.1 alpha/beta hydrolase [Ramlibacter alkalitolerans]
MDSSAAPRVRPPPLSLLAIEPVRGLFTLAAATFRAHCERVGDGHPVVVFPGLGAGPWTTRPLRRFLIDAGFDARCWGRGMNMGPERDFDGWIDILEADVRRWHADSGRKVSLVGWSLGGIYARELGKRAPACVRQVLTLGTPFAAILGATRAERLYRLLNRNAAPLTAELEARLRPTPPVPTTSIYSKSDGIVGWRGCIEQAGALSESIEVRSSHMGLGTDPQVLRIVANRLAQPEGDWRPRTT